MAKDDKQRIGELKDEVKHRDRRIEELRCEIDEQRDLIRRLREHAEDYSSSIDSWCEAFGMEMTEDNKWTWAPFVVEARRNTFDLENLRREYEALIKKHNVLVMEHAVSLKGGRPVGRPLAASDAQRATVLELREAGASLRSIAEETSLGLNTVRTIVSQKNGTSRTISRQRRRVLSLMEYSDWELLSKEERKEARAQARRHKQQERIRDSLPKRAKEFVEEGRALIKEANGLGRGVAGT